MRRERATAYLALVLLSHAGFAGERPNIVLEYCDDVTLKNNRATGFKHPLAVTRSSGTTRVEMKQNEGFRRK